MDLLSGLWYNVFSSEHGGTVICHRQVDTGLGFLCDEGVLPLVKIFNHGKLFTLFSCEDWKEGRYSYIFPNRWVMFKHKDGDEALLAFCKKLASQANIKDETGSLPFELSVQFSHWLDFNKGPSGLQVRATLQYRDEDILPELEKTVTELSE